MSAQGDCPICFKRFRVEELPAHVDACLSGGQSSGHDADFELAMRLQREEQQQDSSTHYVPNKPVESDEDFARRLYQEEQEANKPRGVACQICNNPTPMDNLYILDDCTHKFCRACLKASVTKQVATTVTTICPLNGCTAALSVRDMKDLLPKKEEIAQWMSSGSGSIQATERLIQELKYITKTNPQKQGYSVKPIKDNLYHWEVKFFDFDKSDPIGQDVLKVKDKSILLHVTFPKTYPFHPPFIRVIRPRFAFRTGHVTIGGSVCTELLTNTGWSPANTVEAVLVNIRANLIEGGARIDFSNKHDYTEAEAKDAFERMRQQHGW
eukprot:TRINITY_DN21869_c0_g1_i1.p1 TRINITY_DN21869_c0_g1~~TRINITY_DN21869_c0_g1_i1.p1  ORF type:complete len:337 (+),score=67.29 TRINITY_DN21869_c0_g1_i1:39-1013(+)